MTQIHVDKLNVIHANPIRYDCPLCKLGILYRPWDLDKLHFQRRLVYEKYSTCTQCGEVFEILDGPIEEKVEENPHVIRGRGLEL